MSFKTLIRILAVTTLILNQSWATSTNRSAILLVVNGSPITERDLDQRIRLLSINDGGVKRVSEAQKGEILQSLVQERLQIKAAKDKKINVTSKEITDSIEEMAKESNMTGKQLLSFLQSHGVEKETLEDRLRAQISWVRVVRQQYSPLIHVSDREVEQGLKRLDTQKGRKEYHLYEILLLTPTPSQDAQVRQRAVQLAEDLKKGGMSFEHQARNLSKASTAPKGGDMGWVNGENLEQAYKERVSQMRIGQISDPIKVGGGYKILFLKDLRHTGLVSLDDTEVSLTQVLVPLTPHSSQEELSIHGPQVEELSRTKGCGSFSKKAQSYGYPVQASKGIRMGQLPAQLKEIVAKTPTGSALQPVMTPDGVVVSMVCSRKDPSPVIITKDDVLSDLEQRKYGERAARELQRLRSVACIECKDPKIKHLMGL